METRHGFRGTRLYNNNADTNKHESRFDQPITERVHSVHVQQHAVRLQPPLTWDGTTDVLTCQHLTDVDMSTSH